MDNASKKDDYKIGTIVVSDTENYPKNIAMEELLAQRTSHIPRNDIKKGYCKCDIHNDCGCGGC